MSRLRSASLFLIVISVLLSCKDSTKVTDVITFSGEYIAGSVKTASGQTKAACWINNLLVELPSTASGAVATGLDLKGDVLYVCGYEQRSDGRMGTAHTPVVWANGARTVVANHNALTSAIQIVGDDVFVSGTSFEDTIAGKRAVWWKNGSIYGVVTGGHSSEATGLFVDSLDVYVSGSEVVAEITRARLWKNGRVVELEGGDGMSEANGVVKRGDDVFVFGTFTPFVFPFTSKAAYWKNGRKVEMDLPDGGSSATMTDLRFWGETMYATGSYYSGLKYEACYWENGMFKKMPADSHAEARGISAIRNRIRVIGNLHHGAGVVWDDGTLILQANGSRFNRILYK